LILTPTRELAVQVKDHLTNIARFTNIQIQTIVGGISVEKQLRLLLRQPDIVIYLFIYLFIYYLFNQFNSVQKKKKYRLLQLLEDFGNYFLLEVII